MSVLICPGIHEPDFTQGFLSALQGQLSDCLVFPTETYPAYSPSHLLDFLGRQLGNPLRNGCLLCDAIHVPLVFVSFSAGVVGSIGAAWAWQQLGGTVKAFIALDGWGVPLWGNFPIHRVSHDRFTHDSSALLGAGLDGFYADPAVEHLDLWRSPHTAIGWQIHPPHLRHHGQGERHPIRTTAAQFLLMLFARYEELDSARTGLGVSLTPDESDL